MRISVLSLFPDLIRQFVGSSITGRAQQAGLFALETIQIRDYAVNRYGKVDDYCFGGGVGMLMMAEPVWQAWRAACQNDLPPGGKRRSIYLSPRGKILNQAKAAELSQIDHLILICGHYEGVDQRVLDEIADEELSIGDYVLTGGELAACVVIDALLRLVPGVLPDAEAYNRESHMSGVLEYPQYTRPAKWHGRKVPDVLLSGHQANIGRWQQLAALKETLRRRPDLFQKQQMTAEEWLELLDLSDSL
ncbi:MAG TPA: tRNA (guanosine(37)-N1)-methyltransferase TrmD [Clostridiales bacterium]|nr:tRNA (guanosine(37)-N1)-methyltransferase TrmD [Clostridiales bacterium]